MTALFAVLGFGVACNWIASRSPETRGLAAVGLVLWITLLIPWLTAMLYAAGVRIPSWLADLSVPWPQMVFFGPTLFRIDQPMKHVLPGEWSGVMTLAFWAIVAVLFSTVTRRWAASFAILVLSAAATVVAMTVLVRAAVPLLGWRPVLEFP